MATYDELLTLCAGPAERAQLRAALAEIEEEHRAQRERLFAVFEEAPVFMTVLEGPDLRIAMINRRVRETPPGPAMLGKSARDLYSRDNPVLAAVERVYTTGVPATVHDLPPYFPDGAYSDRFFTRSYTPLLDRSGNVWGILTLGYEVTDEVRARAARERDELRRQAELERLFGLLEEAPILINVLEGPELRIVMMNRATRELFAGRDMIGVSFRESVPPGNLTVAASDRVFASGKSETFEIVSRDVEGFSGRSFSTTVVPVRDPDGRIARVMTASFEITGQRRVQEALEAQARDLESARREAVDASRVKDEFLAMLSHELRNPLAPMLTALELMRLRGAGLADIDLLERQVRHLTRLVDDLLDVSRIARGKVDLQYREVGLSTLVNRALEMTAPLIEQRRHRIAMDLVLVTIHGDSDRLAQALANLITNAAKYSEVGSEIRIAAQRSGDRVRVSVADDGVGMAPDMIGKVFDPFVQQPQMLARSHGGLGLGLSIVKSLIEAHGGSVSAHSDGPGKGSTFTIELPALARPSLRPDDPAPPERTLPVASGRRILVVDDNRDAALMLQQALQALGHRVVIAHDGPSALASASTFKPQVGLLDIGLPVMDGYELAAALRAAHDVRLVAITGYGQGSDHQRSREAGFDAHLVKPVALKQLARLLQELEG